MFLYLVLPSFKWEGESFAFQAMANAIVMPPVMSTEPHGGKGIELFSFHVWFLCVCVWK